jgi:signal transduction histidine kinase
MGSRKATSSCSWKCSFIFHEVRGPLNNLRMSLTLLMASPAVQENEETLAMVCRHHAQSTSARVHTLAWVTLSILLWTQVAIMDESTSIVQRITNDVLVVAKLESSSFQIIYAPFSLRQLLTSIVQQESNSALSKEVSIDIQLPADFHAVLLGDSNRLQQARRACDYFDTRTAAIAHFCGCL